MVFIFTVHSSNPGSGGSARLCTVTTTGAEGTIGPVPPPFRITRQTRLLLAEFLADPAGDHYGFEISKATGLKPSTLYPTFARLEDAGWIEGTWETIDPDKTRRPARRYYRLTSTGLSGASAVLADARPGSDVTNVIGS